MSDHLGTAAITTCAQNLGPAWTVGEGLYSGKKWKSGFLSLPDRTGALGPSPPRDQFLLHPSALDEGQLNRLVSLGLLVPDVREPVTVQMDDQHDAISLRVMGCAF